MRNITCQKRFKEYTSSSNTLSKCFSTDEPINIQFSKWMTKLRKALHACFRKIRVTENEKKMSNIDILMMEKKDILKKKHKNKNDIEKLKLLEKDISDACEDREWSKLVKVLGSLETKNGSTNNTNVWKQMNKAFPKKNKSIPTGVKDIEGNIITNPSKKKKVILDHFVHRICKRPPNEEVKEILNIEEETFKFRLELAKKGKSHPIHIDELEKALKSLKVGKSRDPEGFIADIFIEEVIGSDLKHSLLLMFNKMKDEVTIPQCLKTANITMLYKKKCKLDLNNWRGIFVTSILRTILMKIIHERTYEQVSVDMTESQIGSKKGKNVRNHVFVLNSIISDVLSSVKKPPIDLCVMDYKQMFDLEEGEICLNALYEAGVQDDIFALISEANESNVIAVKTHNGITKRRVI